MFTDTRVDFSNSKLFWNHGSDNSHGVFNVESVLRKYNKNNELINTFVLGAGVLAGNMYVSGSLVKNPSYFFQVAASEDMNVIYRTNTLETEKWRKFLNINRGSGTFDTYNNDFESLEFNLGTEECVEVGLIYSDISMHYLRLHNFTCKIYVNKIDECYELEFPVKHINISPEKEMFQVETGPILIFDSHGSNKTSARVERLIPSFVHFNNSKYADFSIDFPYGVRSSKDRGSFNVERLNCEVKLFSNKKI